MSGDSDFYRDDWPLLFVDRESLGTSGPEALDPIRIQKGMFLLSMRGPCRDLYKFRPYNWGPYSSDLVGDLELLVSRGLLTTVQEPGRNWARFRPTSQGRERAGQMA